jgi:hypothetical protein
MKTVGGLASDIIDGLVYEMGEGVIFAVTTVGLSLTLFGSLWACDVLSTHFKPAADNQKTVIAGPAKAATPNCGGAGEGKPPPAPSHP